MEVASRPIRVQSIAQSGAAPQVPPEYIQPPKTRPNNPTARPANNNPIPSINLSSAVSDAVILRTEIGIACREWGVFHVTNHCVPPKLLDEIRRMGRTFFEACRMDEKFLYSCDTSGAATEGRVVLISYSLEKIFSSLISARSAILFLQTKLSKVRVIYCVAFDMALTYHELAMEEN
ncbi:hypothetical protein RJ639_036839 [Escallonia herrerae]|uniref:Non-haem dioxygenase N-terminal domain-containing protein n=1 Tax=Escallonia herrerae TaxID=1293975 RepID=A0AA88WQZ8_9ASTE|nr:hypothetical protein RJ639_036839 [Escallonia herrerae]